MPNIRRNKAHPESRKTSTRLDPLATTSAGTTYPVYAVAMDGTRRRLNARAIVIEVGGQQLTIGLHADPGLPNQIYVLRKNGVRGRIDAEDIIVELRPGIEVQLDLAPPSAFAGQLTVLTPPTRHMNRLYEAGLVDTFATFFGAENVLHIAVERRVRSTKKKGRRRDPED